MYAARADLFGEESLRENASVFRGWRRSGPERIPHGSRSASGSAGPIALAFVDMHMPPRWDGIETIEHLWRIDPDLYIVICAAFSDHDWARVRDRMPQHDKLLVLRKPYEAIEVWQ